jgi:preprotein translocase subunit SecG
MLIAIKVVHILVCIFLIVVILLQAGKGAEMGAIFGGAKTSSSFFGAGGGAKEMRTITVIAAILFMITSITLSASHRSLITDSNKSVVEELPAPPAAGDVPIKPLDGGAAGGENPFRGDQAPAPSDGE